MTLSIACATLAFLSLGGSVTPAPSAEIVELTKLDIFNSFVSSRNDVWVVVYGIGKPGAYWASAASKLQNVVRVGRVDCARLDSGAGHADAPCSRASKNSAKALVLGYTFDKDGQTMVAAKTYTGLLGATKLVKWALGLTPNLATQLTAHSGTNVFHKEELGNFLKRPRMAKAIFFTTSPKGAPPALVSALAVHFRQRLLVGEVKASDMSLRNAFSVVAPPALIVNDADGKRHIFRGDFKRPPIEKFLASFAASSPDQTLHRRQSAQTEHVKVKKQSYSDADGERTYPKGFNPWRALGLSQSRSIPAIEALQAAYKETAKKWHPDKCKTSKKECETRMSETSLAKSVLSDGRRLQQWEAWRNDVARGKHRGEL